MYSDKQLALLQKWRRGELKRINILEGSVRSGKTWISLVLWGLWVATMPADGAYLMVAKTLTSLRRNCLDLLQSLFGRSKFDYNLSRKEGRLFGRRIYLEGVNDARAESKIRGMTLAGAYCDELTLFTEDFFAMLLSRLSEPGAKLIGTTNPDSPNHWLMTNYIERAGELDMLTMQFLIDDNPFLPAGYVEQLKREYTGVFYERFIRGAWVVAEGLVYPMFDPSRHVIRDTGGDGMYYISVDYGTLNPCAMLLWRVEDGRAVCMREYYHDGRKSMVQKTDEEYYDELCNLAGDRMIQAVVADPSAASFIETIRRHGRYAVRKGNNSVVDGIRVTASMLESGRLLFDESCTATRKEFRAYAWDEKATEDKVIKESDHAMDSLRYLCYTVLRRLWRWEETEWQK